MVLFLIAEMFCKVYQTRSSNVKARVKYMVWTNEMDRCLSKILVEHTKKGYKSDIIKTATYAAAVAELNEKFGLDLTKDHIKNRLKTWRKQYATLKEILAQKGFKWDKARKMVAANDAVWNDYIKVQPDAKHFRAKLIENYDELCAIVGNDEAIVDYSDYDTEADVHLMFENEVVETAIDSDIQSDDKKLKNLRWTKEMDICLGEILVEHVQKGYKVDNVLQHEAYEAAIMDLNKRFGPDLTKDHIRNRLKTWKKQYVVLKELLSYTGFKWDETQKMIIGSDSVWNDYIKTHHDARIFKGKVVENYDHLYIIFGNNHATGSYSRTADDIVHSLAGDSDGVEAINASPVQCWYSMKDQAKNMRWTNEMDRFLSRTLVEQVKLGNKSKLENKFKPAAFVAAVSALNQRFQLDFKKDHVKNRIKTWKKLYGNVKELLEQRGFRWDKEQKMVIANDSIWLDYIKINPEARFLRGRVIENYDDLRIVIGNDDPTESSGNDTETDLNWAAEDSVGAEFAYQNLSYSAKEKGKYLRWTNEMDCCLSKELIKQVKLGNKLEKNFKPVAYTAAVNALNENFALDLTEENIMSRLKTWKKLYGLVKELLSSRGFEWDERRKMIVANDSMWNESIKIHPDARFLRGRSIENYDELCVVIGNDHASEWWSIIGAKADVNPDSNNEEHIEYPVLNMVVNEETIHDNTGEGTQGSSQQTRARPSASSRSKQPSKKRGGSDAMVDMISAMAANIGRIADALTESNQSVCLDELFEMVQNIPGFDDDLIIEACEFLSSDEKRAKMFLKLNERLRKLWLLKRLRSHGS